MEISNHGADQGSWYVNPNTRTLTSNRKNTKIKDRDNFGCMQRLLNHSKNAAGYWESSANSSAKAAYEKAQADNRTFTYADQRIHDQIDYISHYYSDEYTAYESTNYKIEPDKENECFTIYNGQGERLGVFFYSDIKCRRDSSGKELLISENGTMWYDALVLDQELKEDLRHVMGTDSLATEPLQGYSLKTHTGTGIQYLIKDGEEGRGGKVLLQSEADHKKYEALAETYLSKYPNLIGSREEAYIWASFEIRGMAARTEHGILSIHNDSMSYNDDSNFNNNWSIRFMDDVYQKIFEWLQQSGSHREDMQKFSVWQGIFDDIGIDYERIWSKPEEEQGYLNN